MNPERELYVRYLRGLLELVESGESDLPQIRDLIRYWCWNRPNEDEIVSRLSRIEHHLESLASQRCVFAENDCTDLMVRLVTGLEGSVKEGRKHVTKWLSGTIQLTVVDPYFFSFSGANKVYRTPMEYIKAIIELLPKTLKSIEVFHLPGPNRKILSGFQNHCNKEGVSLHKWQTTDVHDRVFIKSETEAIVLGTSFGSLGNKIAFTLDLPYEDLVKFRHELHRIKSKA